EGSVVVDQPAVTVMRPVSYAVIGIRYLLKSLKVVFIVQIEDRSSVIDRRVVKLCVVRT
ncbi:hypothetical protein CC86DRAFT_295542, partial [Ophiobolus disseminans]